MRAFWIPIFSMRSYDTGQYAILKDGNFQLTMARVLASDFESHYVAIPDDSSDFEELLERFRDHPQMYFTKMKYGMNAVETREKFWTLNDTQPIADIVISDITGYSGTKPVIYNFNITKLPELNRPYIDKFFEQDLKSIEQSLFTTVINPRQREYILEVRPDLINKVIAHTKVAHADLLPKFPKQKPVEKVIFWPFRISDKAYQWKQFLEAFEEQGLADDGYFIFVTDPNDTLKTEESYISKEKLSKDEYYRMLSTRPIIVMLDDIDKVLHPGTIEFLEYRCPVITYPSKLYENENTIPDLRWLRKAIEDLVYNVADTQLRNFVYRQGEVDQYFNTTYINVLSN